MMARFGSKCLQSALEISANDLAFGGCSAARSLRRAYVDAPIERRRMGTYLLDAIPLAEKYSSTRSR